MLFGLLTFKSNTIFQYMYTHTDKGTNKNETRTQYIRGYIIMPYDFSKGLAKSKQGKASKTMKRKVNVKI